MICAEAVPLTEEARMAMRSLRGMAGTGAIPPFLMRGGGAVMMKTPDNKPPGCGRKTAKEC